MRKLYPKLTLSGLLLGILFGAPQVHTVRAASSVQFVFPVNDQTLDYEGAYLFKVSPSPQSDVYLWGFFQNGVMVWENLRDEGRLSGDAYGIQPGTSAHSKFQLGDVQVYVRDLINGAWTEATIITIHLRPRRIKPIQPPTPTQAQPPDGAFIKRIERGEAFFVLFDQTINKFNDSIYTGDWRTDPLGTLKGGQTYRVVYKAKGQRWIVTGFNQETGTVLTATYYNADLAKHEISLWGRLFHFTESGDVLDLQYGLVGHISFIEGRAPD